MGLKSRLEIIAEEVSYLPDINKTNRKIATTAGFFVGTLISAKTADLGSGLIKNAWGLSLLSDGLGFLAYESLFLLTYLEENRNRYTKGEKYNSRKIGVATYDLLLNMAPINGFSALITFHLFRDTIQSILMTKGYSPVVSSISADLILIPPYLALREGILNYIPNIKKNIKNTFLKITEKYTE